MFLLLGYAHEFVGIWRVEVYYNWKVERGCMHGSKITSGVSLPLPLTIDSGK